MGCWKAPATPAAATAKPAGPQPFRDIVVAGKRTAAALHAAVAMGDGTFVLFTCISRDSIAARGKELDEAPELPNWPTGAALVRFDRAGKLMVRRPLTDCQGQLLRAGNELVHVLHEQGGPSDNVSITRFDPATLDVTRTATWKAPGPIETIAARADGSLAIATSIDTTHTDAGTEISFVAADGADLGHWRVEGRDIRTSAIVDDGDGVVVAGTIGLAARLDTDVVLDAKFPMVWIARIGPTGRWGKLIGSKVMTPINYEPPRLAKLRDGFALAWSALPHLDLREPHPELDAFGGFPKMPREHIAYARLDRAGNVLKGRFEEVETLGVVLSLQVLPDGAVLEQRTARAPRTERDAEIPECSGKHCDHPEETGTLDAIVARRLDPQTLAVTGETRTHGAAQLVSSAALLVDDAHSLIAAGAFNGTLELPRGKVTSARAVSDPCIDQTRTTTAADRTVLAIPPIDQCRVRVTTFSVLFAQRLAI